MFTVLSSWLSHCESSPGSLDAARVYTHHRHLLLLLSPKADWLLLPAGLRVARSAVIPYSVVQKCFFCPAGATRCPAKPEIWHGGADRRITNHIYIAPKIVKKTEALTQSDLI